MKGRPRPADLSFWLWMGLVVLDIALQERRGIPWYWTVAGLGGWFGLGWFRARAAAPTGRRGCWLLRLAAGVSMLLGLASLVAGHR